MKIIHCPLNGPRNAQEFVYGGDVVNEPDPDATSMEWSRYVFLEENLCGVVDEWWCHSASSYWFVVRRDRLSDDIIETYSVRDYFDTGRQP
jgi:sarcosine oxidase subunit delta